MHSAGSRWFLSLSIRWKLQLAFFVVTMTTIVINRVVGYGELRQLINIAKSNNVAPEVVKQLDGRLDAYLISSLWQSGIEFIVLFVVIGVLANLLVAPIKALCHALEGIERGDLTRQVANTSLDEVGFLERSFNSMLTNLTSIMVKIDTSGKQMAQSAHQIGAISHEIAEVGAHERARSDEVTRATEQLHRSSGAVAELAESAARRALETENRARAGVETVQQNIERMDKTVEEVNRASNEVVLLADASQKIVEAAFVPSPSRPTCWRSMPPSKPPAPANRAVVSRWWRMKCAIWRRAPPS